MTFSLYRASRTAAHGALAEMFASLDKYNGGGVMRDRYEMARAWGVGAIDAVRYAVHRRLSMRISGDVMGGFLVEIF